MGRRKPWRWASPRTSHSREDLASSASQRSVPRPRGGQGTSVTLPGHRLPLVALVSVVVPVGGRWVLPVGVFMSLPGTTQRVELGKDTTPAPGPHPGMRPLGAAGMMETKSSFSAKKVSSNLPEKSLMRWRDEEGLIASHAKSHMPPTWSRA